MGNVEVGDLKNKIKKQCAVSFENVDAHHLELWKVSTIDDPLCLESDGVLLWRRDTTW